MNQKDYNIKKQTSEKNSIIDEIILLFQNIFLGKENGDFETRRFLKRVKRRLNSLPIKVFDPKNEVILAKFPEILFEIYRYTKPLKEIININKTNQIRLKVQNFFVESQLTEFQTNLLKSFEKDNMSDILAKKGTEGLDNFIMTSFKEFQKSFDSELVNRINDSYTVLNSLNEIIHLDIYPILKKFSPEMREDSISKIPYFREVNGKHILTGLLDLSEVIYSVNTNADFLHSINLFEQLRQAKLTNKKELNIVINRIAKLVKNDYVPLMISYLQKDPYFKPASSPKTINLIQIYNKNIIALLKDRRNEVIQSDKSSKVQEIVKSLFNTTDVKTLKNYVEVSKEQFKAAKTDHYIYALALNYLKHFIMEKYNHYIYENVNKILVSGEFSDQQSNTKLLESFYKITELMKDILKLDNSIGESTKIGMKIKSLLRLAVQDPINRKVLSGYIDNLNGEAKRIITTGITNLTQIGSILKLIIEDHKTNSKKVLINVREIDGLENKILINDIIKAFNDISKILLVIKSLMP